MFTHLHSTRPATRVCGENETINTDEPIDGPAGRTRDVCGYTVRTLDTAGYISFRFLLVSRLRLVFLFCFSTGRTELHTSLLDESLAAATVFSRRFSHPRRDRKAFDALVDAVRAVVVYVTIIFPILFSSDFLVLRPMIIHVRGVSARSEIVL